MVNIVVIIAIFYVGGLADFHPWDFNLLRFSCTSIPLLILYGWVFIIPTRYLPTLNDFLIVLDSLEDRRIRFFLIGAIFFNVSRTANDIEFPWRCLMSMMSRSITVKSYALPKRNSTMVLFLTSLRISSLVSVKLQQYDSQNGVPAFIKCVKLYEATERCSSKFAQNLSGDFVNYT